MAQGTRWVHIAALAVASATFTARVAHTQPVAEYLFWDSVGKSAAAGVKNYEEYRAQRELWTQKIAEAKAALDRCGSCAQQQKLEKELAYWQNTERQFQKIAGAAAAAVGMPPAVAKWLGINAPMAPPPSRSEWIRMNRVVRPAWVDDRPPFCQKASDAYLQCLRDYQTRSGTLPTEAAKIPGGACYDGGKLFRHCFAEDYDAFEREKVLRAARASGKIIPEFATGTAYHEVYYGEVPDRFVPTLPAEVVRKSLADRPVGVRLSTRKAGTGFVDNVLMRSFAPRMVAPSSECFSGRSRGGEIERRICDDFATLSYKERPPVLTCQYIEPGSSRSRAYEAHFWFGGRPALADPKRLLSRAADHPVLSIGDARSACPVTRREAEQATASWDASIKRLRAATLQTAANVELPESAWRTEARAAHKAAYEAGVDRGKATDDFPIVGMYSFETNGGGRSLSGQCVISPVGLVKIMYLLRCSHAGGNTTMQVSLLGGYLRTVWREGGAPVPLNYQVDQSNPNALVAQSDDSGGSGRLVRTGDLPSLSDVAVAGMYRFEVNTDRGKASGRCTIGKAPGMTPPGFTFDCTADGGQSFSNTGRQTEDGTAIVVTWPVLAGHALHGLVFVAGAQDGAAGAARPLIGANDSGARVRLVPTNVGG